LLEVKTILEGNKIIDIGAGEIPYMYRYQEYLMPLSDYHRWFEIRVLVELKL
jgi:hypothetical protein